MPTGRKRTGSEQQKSCLLRKLGTLLNASHIITLCSWAKFKFALLMCKWVRLPHTIPMMALRCQTVSVPNLHTVRPRKHFSNFAFPIYASKESVLPNCLTSPPDSFPPKSTPRFPLHFQSLSPTTCTLPCGPSPSVDVIICHCAFVVTISCDTPKVIPDKKKHWQE